MGGRLDVLVVSTAVFMASLFRYYDQHGPYGPAVLPRILFLFRSIYLFIYLFLSFGLYLFSISIPIQTYMLVLCIRQWEAPYGPAVLPRISLSFISIHPFICIYISVNIYVYIYTYLDIYPRSLY